MKKKKDPSQVLTELLNKYECCDHDFEHVMEIARVALNREISPQDLVRMIQGAVFIFVEEEKAEAKEAADEIINKAKRSLKK